MRKFLGVLAAVMILFSPTSVIQAKTTLKYLGNFTLTAYCGCKSCNGSWAGTTALGVRPVASKTIAVDPKVIKLGSKVKIGNEFYVAQDTGGAIKGKKIDIFFATHSEALDFGRKSAKVWAEH